MQPAVSAVAFELLRQPLMCRVGLRDDEKTRGVLVEAVNDARTFDTANAREAVTAMGNQSIHQGPSVVSGGRMHDQAGRLIDHDDVLVLVHDVECDLFALNSRLFSRRNANRVCQARFDRRARLSYRVACADVTFANERLNASAADAFDFRCKPSIDTLAGIFRPRDDVDVACCFFLDRHVITRKKT